MNKFSQANLDTRGVNNPKDSETEVKPSGLPPTRTEECPPKRARRNLFTQDEPDAIPKVVLDSEVTFDALPSSPVASDAGLGTIPLFIRDYGFNGKVPVERGIVYGGIKAAFFEGDGYLEIPEFERRVHINGATIDWFQPEGYTPNIMAGPVPVLNAIDRYAYGPSCDYDGNIESYSQRFTTQYPRPIMYDTCFMCNGLDEFNFYEQQDHLKHTLCRFVPVRVAHAGRMLDTSVDYLTPQKYLIADGHNVYLQEPNDIIEVYGSVSDQQILRCVAASFSFPLLTDEEYSQSNYMYGAFLQLIAAGDPCAWTHLIQTASFLAHSYKYVEETPRSDLVFNSSNAGMQVVSAFFKNAKRPLIYALLLSSTRAVAVGRDHVQQDNKPWYAIMFIYILKTVYDILMERNNNIPMRRMRRSRSCDLEAAHTNAAVGKIPSMVYLQTPDPFEQGADFLRTNCLGIFDQLERMLPKGAMSVLEGAINHAGTLYILLATPPGSRRLSVQALSMTQWVFRNRVSLERLRLMNIFSNESVETNLTNAAEEKHPWFESVMEWSTLVGSWKSIQSTALGNTIMEVVGQMFACSAVGVTNNRGGVMAIVKKIKMFFTTMSLTGAIASAVVEVARVGANMSSGMSLHDSLFTHDNLALELTELRLKVQDIGSQNLQDLDQRAAVLKDKWLKQIESQPRNSLSANYLNMCLLQTGTIQQGIRAQMKMGSKKRQPAVFLFTGGNGIGKSEIIQRAGTILTAERAKRFGPQEQVNSSISPSDKYDSQCTSATTCVIIDDLGYTRPDLAAGEKAELPCSKLGRLTNTNLDTFTKADVDSKGKEFMNHWLILASSNSDNGWVTYGVTDEGAATRRFTLVTQMRCRSEYRDSDGRPDPSLFPDDGGGFPAHCDYRFLKWTRSGEKIASGWMGPVLAVYYIRNAYNKLVFIQDRLDSRAKTNDVCDECKMPSAVCQCQENIDRARRHDLAGMKRAEKAGSVDVDNPTEFEKDLKQMFPDPWKQCPYMGDEEWIDDDVQRCASLKPEAKDETKATDNRREKTSNTKRKFRGKKYTVVQNASEVGDVNIAHIPEPDPTVAMEMEDIYDIVREEDDASSIEGTVEDLTVISGLGNPIRGFRRPEWPPRERPHKWKEFFLACLMAPFNGFIAMAVAIWLLPRRIRTSYALWAVACIMMMPLQPIAVLTILQLKAVMSCYSTQIASYDVHYEFNVEEVDEEIPVHDIDPWRSNMVVLAMSCYQRLSQYNLANIMLPMMSTRNNIERDIEAWRSSRWVFLLPALTTIGNLIGRLSSVTGVTRHVQGVLLTPAERLQNLKYFAYLGLGVVSTAVVTKLVVVLINSLTRSMPNAVNGREAESDDHRERVLNQRGPWEDVVNLKKVHYSKSGQNHSLNTLKEKVHGNLYRVIHDGKGPERVICTHGFMLNSHLLLVPHHFLKNHPGTITIYKDLFRRKIKLGAIKHYPEIDLSVIHMGGTPLGSKPDLLKYMVRSAPEKGMLIHALVRGDDEIGMFDSSQVDYDSVIIQNVEPKTAFVDSPSIPTASYASNRVHRGDCAAPILVGDETRSNIVGFHIGISTRGSINRMTFVTDATIKSIELFLNERMTLPPVEITKIHKVEVEDTCEVHERNAVNWLPQRDGTITQLLDCVPKKSTPSMKSRRGPIADQLAVFFTLPDFAPVRNNPKQYRTAMVHATKSSPGYDEEAMAMAQCCVYKKYAAIIAEGLKWIEDKGVQYGFTRGTYTLDEVVNGRENNKYRNGIRKDTSAGFPHCTQKSKLLVERPDGKWDLGPELLKSYNDLEERISREEHPGTAFTATLKDEARSAAKAEQPRVFYAGNVESLMANVRVMGPMIDLLLTEAARTGIAVGVSPFDRGWEAMVGHVQEEGRVGVPVDYRGWDISIFESLKAHGMKLFYDLLKVYYTEEQFAKEKHAITALLNELVTPIVSFNGALVVCPSLWPSGTFLTAYVGSLLEELLQAYSFCKTCKMDPYEDDRLRFLGLGDDNGTSIRADLATVWNRTHLQQDLAGIEITVTDPDKKSELTPTCDVRDIEFLKRDSVRVPGLPFIVGRLKFKSIMKAFCVMIKSREITMDEQLRAIAQSCLTEAVLHGEVIFNVYLDIIATIFEQRGIPLDEETHLLPWEDRVAKMAGEDCYDPLLISDMNHIKMCDEDSDFWSYIRPDIGDFHPSILNAEEAGITQIEAVDDDLVVDSIASPDTDAMRDDFGHSVDRLVQIGTVNIVPEKKLFALVDTSTIFEDSYLKGRLSHVAHIRCAIEVRVLVSGASSHYGSMYVSASAGFKGKPPGVVSVHNEGTLLQMSQMRHTKLIIGDNENECTLKIPIITPYRYPTIAQAAEYAPIVYICTITQLRHSFGLLTAVPVTIMARLVDVEMHGATAYALNAAESGEKFSDKLSTVSSTLRDISSVTSRIPYLGSTMNIGSIATEAVANILRSFGFSKPVQYPDTSTVIQGQPLAVTEGPVHGRTMSLFRQQGIALQPLIKSQRWPDELSFDFHLSSYNHHSTKTWKAEAPSGTLLRTMHVSPIYWATTPSGGLVLPQCGLVASQFTYWHGTMIYKISVRSPSSLGGKLLISYDPLGGNSTRSPSVTTNLTYILDLRVQTEIVVEVGWYNGRYALVVQSPWYSDYYGYSPEVHNGLLKIHVMSQLISMNDKLIDADIHVEAKAGKDMVFAEHSNRLGDVNISDSFGTPAAYSDIDADHPIMSLGLKDLVADTTTGDNDNPLVPPLVIPVAIGDDNTVPPATNGPTGVPNTVPSATSGPTGALTAAPIGATTSTPTLKATPSSHMPTAVPTVKAPTQAPTSVATVKGLYDDPCLFVAKNVSPEIIVCDTARLDLMGDVLFEPGIHVIRIPYFGSVDNPIELMFSNPCTVQGDYGNIHVVDPAAGTLQTFTREFVMENTESTSLIEMVTQMSADTVWKKWSVQEFLDVQGTKFKGTFKNGPVGPGGRLGVHDQIAMGAYANVTLPVTNLGVHCTDPLYDNAYIFHLYGEVNVAGTRWNNIGLIYNRASSHSVLDGIASQTSLFLGMYQLRVIDQQGNLLNADDGTGGMEKTESVTWSIGSSGFETDVAKRVFGESPNSFRTLMQRYHPHATYEKKEGEAIRFPIHAVTSNEKVNIREILICCCAGVRGSEHIHHVSFLKGGYGLVAITGSTTANWNTSEIAKLSARTSGFEVYDQLTGVSGVTKWPYYSFLGYIAPHIVDFSDGDDSIGIPLISYGIIGEADDEAQALLSSSIGEDFSVVEFTCCPPLYKSNM